MHHRAKSTGSQRPSITTGLVANAGLIVAGHVDGPPRARSVDRQLGSHRVRSRPGRKILHSGRSDDRRGDPHRSRQHAACRRDPGGVAVQGDGTLDDRDVPADASRSVTSANSTPCFPDPGPGLGLGAGPGDEPFVIDLDSTICEVHGNSQTRRRLRLHPVLGYHPLLATRAGTGEVLFARMRQGSANTAEV